MRANKLVECYHKFGSFSSASNDVWSLGVILVNLTCGRNPWKSRSVGDPQISSYLKDPDYLGSILPLSRELGSILRGIFECDPMKRIGIVGNRDFGLPLARDLR